MNEHYDENYFNWQKNIGAFGGWANLMKFEKYITPETNVIDFGCGGGFLLKNINCNGKIGIEINDAARKNIDNFGIRSFKYVQDAPDNWADCIISNHALEHVPDPFNQILLLKQKLKTGGKIIFVVPYDLEKYKPNNINFHLFSWSPMNIGNLFTAAGYKVIESKTLHHYWPPFYQKIAKIFGKLIFNLICRIYGNILSRYSSQVRVVAEKV
jgi:SAM-dependent methyltransferase